MDNSNNYLTNIVNKICQTHTQKQMREGDTIL
jgi:hypothetical protein